MTKRTLRYADLQEFRDFSISKFKEFPGHFRLPGMNRYLTTEEVRLLSIYEGVLTFLVKNKIVSNDDVIPVEKDLVDLKPVIE